MVEDRGRLRALERRVDLGHEPPPIAVEHDDEIVGARDAIVGHHRVGAREPLVAEPDHAGDLNLGRGGHLRDALRDRQTRADAVAVRIDRTRHERAARPQEQGSECFGWSRTGDWVPLGQPSSLTMGPRVATIG